MFNQCNISTEIHFNTVTDVFPAKYVLEETQFLFGLFSLAKFLKGSDAKDSCAAAHELRGLGCTALKQGLLFSER